MRRREFLKTSIAAAGAAALGKVAPAATQPEPEVRTEPREMAVNGGGLYSQNRSPLQSTPFLKLPPGSIKPKGWLKHQLELQVEGLNGRLSEISDYLNFDTCGWVDPKKDAWEELPYWLRGFTDLGIVTGDERVKSLTKKWIDGILATQQPDGWFGPTSLRTSLEGGPDFWPGMPLLHAMRSYYESTGDSRILPFFAGYFKFQSKQPSEVFKRSWGSVRWGDNIDSVFWLYNITGEPWLLDVATMMHRESADYMNGIPTWHNVNLAQGFREPAQYGQLGTDPKFLAATYRNYDTIMAKYGQFAGGGFAGDENCREGFGDPRQGFETCGYAEFMHSFEMLTRISGDPVWADRTEEIAFNSFPAAFDPQQKGLHYITCANSIELDNSPKKHGQFQNDFAMLAYMPGIHNYRCCPHNYGMAWPYYAEELWLATSTRGLCASLYAASEVEAKVGDGTTVKIVQDTDYPFSDVVHMELSMGTSVKFPLYLRIPRWCEHATVRINGKPVAVDAHPSSYVILDRTWKNGDKVALHLPMRTMVRTWTTNKNSVSVDHGPITFSLAFQEKWTRIGGNDQWPEYQVTSDTPWNYALVLDKQRPERSFDVVRKGGRLADNPFTIESIPIELKAKARKVGAWKADDEQVVGLLPESPVKGDDATEVITLVPMAAARLRITSFPTCS
jgi:hypothetical protein